MEEDKRKKKNKKKKNKQATKQGDSVTHDARESTSDSQSHVQEIERDNNGQVSGIIDSSNDVGGHVDADRGEHHANGSKGTNLGEAEKQYWLDREALLEERIKQLLKEKDENAQIEALLEEKIKQLLKEKDENAQKEAGEREKLKQLYDEKNASMQNEANLREKLIQLEKEKDALNIKEGILEQRIQQLQREMDVHLQKEASLEAKILQLEGEKDSWAQKEVGFEDKINQLVDEAAFLNLRGNSAKESVASLNNENIKLRTQVIELEQSRESLLEEKQHLTQTVSSLQLQINNLESTAGFRHSSVENKLISEDGDVNYQIEAARALVEKLITENSELVEKVNELYAELDRRGVRTEHFSSAGSVSGDVADQSVVIDESSAVMPDLTIGADDGSHSTGQATDSISEFSKMMPISGSTQSLEDVMIEDQGNSELLKVNDGRGLANSSEITEADEIVQIPIDESEVKETKLEVPQNDEKTDVVLTDAPLIGAPFRLISFVARYVSGADLVNKNTGNSNL
ncbi:hypothetical protein DH2020_048081 [Rehmannia glutinosa]|uniref:Uncharacterized protein n=1 Tax=Rehmannia glutinosa TaxID=99300 RepID=A0ABR0U7S7_REHGL